jgi:thymidylate synthase (FAD)
MYMAGNLRSWMHYCALRSGNGTQLEHQDIACDISDTLHELFPNCWAALLDAARKELS